MARNSDLFNLPQLIKLLCKCFYSPPTAFVYTKAPLHSWLKWLTPPHIISCASLLLRPPAFIEVRPQIIGKRHSHHLH